MHAKVELTSLSLPLGSLTGKIFDAFLCRDFGYGKQALLADYRFNFPPSTTPSTYPRVGLRFCFA